MSNNCLHQYDKENKTGTITEAFHLLDISKASFMVAVGFKSYIQKHNERVDRLIAFRKGFLS